ncbi:MAG: hypothetical protein E5X53_17310 [Mesorhizobium sp.]|uniref:hypothetical protein n=1 Tax=Mesorhizobium sp. TaxID=1871066 RepID=UPI000FE54CE7|nr:hypothetical protein [Mesorhizobium sp.]RWM11233.1 MAG: hypothetical protein EOR73_32390 [Mesorhizobium sp.]TIP73324.1 MAG: hypothetical protein E5X55_14480 [Mesorhizobium sp.]TIQ11341.1 MAG: hypothetical protein E5X57_18355 [Mesorhizobium sp.]TIR50922.1 MAG: hypothetical protein E5X53_17310 [Mesorhizobium sp.]
MPPPAAPAAEASARSGEAPRPVLSFVDAYKIRAAARDTIRQSVLENLLDDRHDLTGNSVYGLKFDTTVYPGRFTAGRAFVRLSITGQSDLILEEVDPANKFPDLPYHLRKYFQSKYSDIKNNPNNPNYNSFNLYTQWLANVRWRLNSHFLQIMETKCVCKQPQCASPPTSWRQEISSTVNTVLALDNAKLRGGGLIGGSGISLEQVALPDPWDKFLAVTVRIPSEGGCANRPEFSVDRVDDTIHIRPNKEQVPGFVQVDELDGEESAYVFVPQSGDPNANLALYWPHYRNLRSITRYVKSIGEIEDCPKSDEACAKYVTIPAGYFNFIEKVIQPDMYAYSLFPRMEATSVLSGRSNTINIDYPAGTEEGGSQIGFDATDRSDRASLEPMAVGFTDSQSTKSIDFGWVIDIGAGGAPFQKSQFALISVPAWTSRLTVTVRTGWLGSSSEENGSEPYSYSVPIPPDYEAFDAFIGGEEAVRRPQINDELMDQEIDLVACRKASILIPGLRLWRSAMVTVGSERADRITVLPNMRGIIAEFTKLSRPVKLGAATLRVWTSEGVDTQPDKVTISLPDDLTECGDKPAPADSKPVTPVPETTEVAPEAPQGAPVPGAEL